MMSASDRRLGVKARRGERPSRASTWMVSNFVSVNGKELETEDRKAEVIWIPRACVRGRTCHAVGEAMEKRREVMRGVRERILMMESKSCGEEEGGDGGRR